MVNKNRILAKRLTKTKLNFAAEINTATVANCVRVIKVFRNATLKKKTKKNNKPKQQELRATLFPVPGNADKLVGQVGMEVLGVHFTRWNQFACPLPGTADW